MSLPGRRRSASHCARRPTWSGSREWSRRAALAATCSARYLLVEVEVLRRALLEPQVLVPFVLLVGLLGIRGPALIDLLVLEGRPDLGARLVPAGGPDLGARLVAWRLRA